jgi:hypothetical protein
MRRIAVFLAIVSLFAFGFAFNVSAQAPRQPSSAAPEKLRDATSPMSRDVRHELRRIRSLAPNVTLCSSITANSDVSKLIDCLNRVTKFAKSTQRELNALDKFVNKFFNCTSYTQLTQYGDPAGSQGYLYDPGTGTPFKITALDLTENLQTDPFLNYYVVRPTTACLAFAQ